MQGKEMIFMAPRSRRHEGKPVIDAIISIAESHGIKRYTRRVNSESIGTSGHTHSAHFFELVDEPEELMFILFDAKADELLAAVKAEAVNVFCVSRAIDYWELG